MYEYTLAWTCVKRLDKNERPQPNLIFEINIYLYVCLCEPVCKDWHTYTNIYKYMKNIYKYIYTTIHKCIQTYTIIHIRYAKIHKHIHMCSYFHSYTITYTIIPRLSHSGKSRTTANRTSQKWTYCSIYKTKQRHNWLFENCLTIRFKK